MTLSQNQLSKENINLIRLINRLDKLSNQPSFFLNPMSRRQQNPNNSNLVKNSDSDGVNEDGHEDGQLLDVKSDEEETRQWYWELKSLETTIRHAKTILDTIDSNPIVLQTISQIQDPVALKDKLRMVQDRIQAALVACPPPSPPTTPPPPLYAIKTPELPVTPKYVRVPSPELSVPTTEKADDVVERVERSPEVKKRSDGPLTQRVLEHRSATEDALTDELSQMASQLKKNVHHFNKLLAEDKAVVAANQTQLDLNASSMKREGSKLGEVSLKSRQMSCFTITAVVAVAIAWIIMFIIIRLT